MSGVTQEAFLSDTLLKAAVERWMEIISEASRHIPAERKAKFPDLNWRDIAGFGNVLRHDYEAVQPDILWDSARDDLPKLRDVIETMIAAEGGWPRSTQA